MATTKKKTTGTTTKKRTRSTPKKKRVTKKNEEQPVVEVVKNVEEVQTPIAQVLENISPRLPDSVIIDGKPVPLNGIAPGEIPVNPAPPATPVPPTPPVVTPVPSQRTSVDDREAARVARMQRRQREREQNGHAAAAVNQPAPAANPPVPAVQPVPVASVPPIQPTPPVNELGQPTPPNTQQLAAEALKTVMPPQAQPQQQQPNPAALPVPPPSADHPDLKIPISELFQYKIQVLEGQMRELAAPIRAQLKAQAEQWLKDAIVSTLAQNEAYQVACRQTENCVNELLAQLAPTLPEGYAVVLIGAKEGQAICRYAPDQAGKRFKID